MSRYRRTPTPMTRSLISAKTRKRARSLRREMTKAERIMWNLLREFRRDGAHFRREAPIGPYFADIAWLSARIVIEVDGDSHETAAGKAHDRTRDAFLRGEGFQVVRFDNSDLLNSIDHLHARIAALLAPHLNNSEIRLPEKRAAVAAGKPSS